MKKTLTNQYMFLARGASCDHTGLSPEQMQQVSAFSRAQTVPAVPTSVPKKANLWILSGWRDLIFYVGTPLLLVPMFALAQEKSRDRGHDVRPQVDVRSLYAVALDWLGGPTDEVLGGHYETYGLLKT